MHAAASTAARIEEAIAIPLHAVARRREASTFLIWLRPVRDRPSRPTAGATTAELFRDLLLDSGPRSRPGHSLSARRSRHHAATAASVHQWSSKRVESTASWKPLKAPPSPLWLHSGQRLHINGLPLLSCGSWDIAASTCTTNPQSSTDAHPARPGHVSRFFRAMRTGRFLAVAVLSRWASLSFDGDGGWCCQCDSCSLRDLDPAPIGTCAASIDGLGWRIRPRCGFGLRPESCGSNRRPSFQSDRLRLVLETSSGQQAAPTFGSPPDVLALSVLNKQSAGVVLAPVLWPSWF